MMIPDQYNTIDKPSVAEFKDRGSRFIALAFPLSTIPGFKSKLAEVKSTYPKATHYCFAYRLGYDGAQFRVSDDGEPSGSAGRPILGQIDQRKLTNVLVVVVRYFGGTLLGVPGLINAYRSAASLALQVTPVVQKQVMIPFRLEFDYTRLNDVMQVLRQYDCIITEKDMNLFCSLKLLVPKKSSEETVAKMGMMPGVTVQKIVPDADLAS
jgi:uncharacterized YigZ family protein